MKIFLKTIKDIKSDFYIITDRAGFLGFIKYYLFNRGFRAVVYYRIARLLYLSGIRIIPDLMVARMISITGAEIPYTAQIGEGLRILHPSGVVVGARSVIGKNCTMMQGVTIGYKWDGNNVEFPVVGDDVVIGSGVKILGEIRIGNHVTIGANAVVIENVSDNLTVAGIPAKNIG
jgi:serine O-acetyltransferase